MRRENKSVMNWGGRVLWDCWFLCGSGNNTKRKMVNKTDQNGAAVLLTDKHMAKTQTTYTPQTTQNSTVHLQGFHSLSLFCLLITVSVVRTTSETTFMSSGIDLTVDSSKVHTLYPHFYDSFSLFACRTKTMSCWYNYSYPESTRSQALSKFFFPHGLEMWSDQYGFTSGWAVVYSEMLRWQS